MYRAPRLVIAGLMTLVVVAGWCYSAWSESDPRVISIEAGGSVACVLLADRMAKCWGDNRNGELGNGTRTHAVSPVQVSGLSEVSMITTRGGHSCAVLTDGAVRCWGANTRGQVGISNKADDVLLPTPVAGLTSATAIASGLLHTCAVLRDGTVRCWGGNSYGQLGNGTTTDSLKPVVVKKIGSAVAVTAGEEHTCALLREGTVVCWGHNRFGMLGSDTLKISAEPVMVPGLISVVGETKRGQESLLSRSGRR